MADIINMYVDIINGYVGTQNRQLWQFKRLNNTDLYNLLLNPLRVYFWSLRSACIAIGHCRQKLVATSNSIFNSSSSLSRRANTFMVNMFYQCYHEMLFNGTLFLFVWHVYIPNYQCHIQKISF